MTADSTALVVATVALVPATFGALLPPLSEVRDGSTTPGRRAGVVAAGMLAAGAVAAVAIGAGSTRAGVAGGLAVVVFAALYTNAVELPSWPH